MPVQKLKGAQLEQICANCSAINTINYTTLELGVSAEGGARTNKDVIRLPACPACGAVENLLRNWDDASGILPPGHRFEHRKVVNRLGAKLKQTGRVNAGCVALIAAETGDPPNTHPVDPSDPDPHIDIGPPPWAHHDQGT